MSKREALNEVTSAALAWANGCEASRVQKILAALEELRRLLAIQKSPCKQPVSTAGYYQHRKSGTIIEKLQ